MSTVILQVGQCGNQIGQDLWTLINNDEASKLGHVYFHQEDYIRSVNVDTEPKVLQRLKENQVFRIRPANILGSRRGCGTNWALGYYGNNGQETDRLLERTVEAVRKEVERCSSYSGLMMIHSLSGGTGSGLGSRLCETLAEEYPLHQMINCVVMPHSSGESPLQYYNALLCLSTMQRYSDCIMCFHNDDILQRLQKRQSEGHGVSYPNMNKHIVQCLAGIMLPTDTLTAQSGVSIGQEPWELIRSLCPLPAHKFVLTDHLSKRKSSGACLTGLLGHELKKHSAIGEPYYSLSTLVVARGRSAADVRRNWKTTEDEVRRLYNCVAWNPFPVDFWSARANSLGGAHTSSLTVASNRSSILDHLTTVYEKARMKFEAKAYLHWYEKYGCEQSYFEEAFAVLDDCIQGYKEVIT